MLDKNKRIDGDDDIELPQPDTTHISAGNKSSNQ